MFDRHFFMLPLMILAERGLTTSFFDNGLSTSLKNVVNRELTFTGLYQSGCS